MYLRSSLLLLTLVACSSDPPAPTTIDAPATSIDAPPPVDAAAIDAPPSGGPSVTAIACPASTVPTVSATSGKFVPTATSVAVDGIVKFTMPGSHSVVPDNSLPTDTGLNVDFDETKCLKFSKAGTFNFKCNPHGFRGTITVN